MKTRLLFTLTFMFALGFAFSQNLVLSHEGEPLEPNAEISTEGPANAEEIVVELAVTNTGNSSIDVLCQRYENDMVPGSSSAFCWGYLCYPPWTSLSGYHHTIGPGMTVDDDFSGHYYPDGNVGISTIAYTFFDLNNPNDSVMVTVLYDGLTVGIDELSQFDQMNVYPNPANEFIQVDLNTEKMQEAVTFQLIDVNGAVIQEVRSSNTEIRMNTIDLANGIYVYRVLVNNQVIGSEKIVIQH